MGQQRTGTDQLLIGESPAIQELRAEIPRVARGKQSVLIQGATGTGKELVARALHTASRRPGRFVDVNVAAISETLFESELFGHVRGAFSGATNDRAGLFRSAEHGTLFLDEIGELSFCMQAKLLRVLEQREVWPVGADTGRSVDLRVITATNANLSILVERQRFRPDLLYRLRGTVLSVPLLSERVGDIPMLADHFLRVIAAEYNEPVLGLASCALDVLCAHSWPGNARELRQVLEHAALRADEPVLRDVHVTCALQHDAIASPPSVTEEATNTARHRLLDALAAHRGDAQAAARSLGVSRATLYRHMRKFGIALRKIPTTPVSDAQPCPSSVSHVR
jgi:DNA-binding NtrC family response regulator